MRFIQADSRGTAFRTSSHLRSSLLAGVLFSLLLPSHVPAAQEATTEQQSVANAANPTSRADKSLSDAQRLRGHWVVVKMRFAGSPDVKPGSDVQYVFTEKEMKYSVPRGPIAAGLLLGADGTLGGKYRLDAEKSPSRIDIETPRGRLVGIYRFER